MQTNIIKHWLLKSNICFLYISIIAYCNNKKRNCSQNKEGFNHEEKSYFKVVDGGGVLKLKQHHITIKIYIF